MFLPTKGKRLVNGIVYIDDVNSAERSELMRLTFLSSQTLITLSIDVLTVTSVQNETLRFVRSDL